MSAAASTGIFDGLWFGPAPRDEQAARAALREAREPLDVLRAAVDVCKLGDMTPRAVIIDMLQIIRDPAFTREAQDVVLAIARHDDLLDDRTTSYLASAGFDVVATFAGSATAMLAKAAVPLLFTVLEESAGDPELAPYAFSGLRALLGLDGSLSESSDIDELAEAAQARMHAVDAYYVLGGEPFSPASVAKSMTAHAMRALDAATPYTNVVEASRLSIWSGLRCPIYSAATIGQTDVRGLVEYATALAALPWRPGTKYFYGHDVDGGPGLRA